MISSTHLVLRFALADGVLKMSEGKFIAGRKAALNDACKLSEAEEGAMLSGGRPARARSHVDALSEASARYRTIW